MGFTGHGDLLERRDYAAALPRRLAIFGPACKRPETVSPRAVRACSCSVSIGEVMRMKWIWVLLGVQVGGGGAGALPEPLPFALPAGKPAVHGTSQPAAAQPVERGVIREAALRVRSRDPHRAAVDATQIAAAVQGMVPQNELRSAGGQVAEAEVRLRVSQSAFESTLRRL